MKASDIAQSQGAKLAKLAESAVNQRNSCADKHKCKYSAANSVNRCQSSVGRCRLRQQAGDVREWHLARHHLTTCGPYSQPT